VRKVDGCRPCVELACDALGVRVALAERLQGSDGLWRNGGRARGASVLGDFDFKEKKKKREGERRLCVYPFRDRALNRCG
jgi:hypothetical protein